MAVTLSLLLAGCSEGERKADPKQIEASSKQVAAAVARFEQATQRRNFKAICARLFTPGARERAGGKDCAKLLRSTAADVRRPRIRVLSIRIRGARAEARVRTRARGQAPLDDRIVLERRRGRYLIEALVD